MAIPEDSRLKVKQEKVEKMPRPGLRGPKNVGPEFQVKSIVVDTLGTKKTQRKPDCHRNEHVNWTNSEVNAVGITS